MPLKILYEESLLGKQEKAFSRQVHSRYQTQPYLKI